MVETLVKVAIVRRKSGMRRLPKNKFKIPTRKKIGEHDGPKCQPKIKVSKKSEPEILNLSFHD